MRGTDNRTPLLAAILVALLLAAMPGTAQAQGVLGGTTNFDASTCVQNQMNAYTNHAQGQTAARANIFSHAANPDMKQVYCWQTIEGIINTIGIYTSGASLLGAFIWSILWGVIQSLLDAVCHAVVSAIDPAINMVNSLLCVPLPSFSLGASFSFGNFGGGNCNGVQLLSLTPTVGVRPAAPYGYSPTWNYLPPGTGQ